MENGKKKEKSEQCLAFLSQINEALSTGQPLSPRLRDELLIAKAEDLDWDIFYALIDLPEEQESGYWVSARVAAVLLKPAISMQFYKNQNARVNENVDEDFTTDVLMVISSVLPKYDKTKAQFPRFIQLYICQAGYVHNKDSSVYLQKKKGIRIFSQDSYAEGTDNQNSGDSYSKVSDSLSIEDEVERKESLRKTMVFNNAVIKKAFSGKEMQKNHADVEQLLLLKDEARLLKLSALEEQSDANTERIASIERMLADSESKNKIELDWEHTITNAAIWAKFLGGVGSFDNLFIDKISEAVEKENAEREELSI